MSNDGDKYRKVVMEKAHIKERFPGFECQIKGKKLFCRGKLKPTEHSNEYRIEVAYVPWNSPKIKVLKPQIEPKQELHFYKNGTLCLYDWREQPWQDKWRLADTVIPWTSEWLLYYETYLLSGKWIGMSAIHKTIKTEQPEHEDERVTIIKP